MRGIWLHTVKKWVTGTTLGSSYALDVSHKSAVLKEYRFQDASVTGINASSGAYVEIGDTNHAAANISNTCTEMRVANNTGAALLIGVGANAGSVTVKGVVAAGQIGEAVFGVALSSGDKVWVKAVQNSAVSTGELLVSFYA